MENRIEQLLNDEEHRRNALLKKREQADTDADDMLAQMEQQMESMLSQNRSLQKRSEK